MQSGWKQVKNELQGQLNLPEKTLKQILDFFAEARGNVYLSSLKSLL
jgi:hypothetical protein